MKRAVLRFAASFLLAASQLSAQSLPGGTITGAAAFGRALGVAGRDVVVGEPAIEGGAGRVYIYRRTGPSWTEVAKVAASDSAADDGFGHTIATGGDLFIVGAQRGNNNRGAAYVFQREQPEGWKQVARLTTPDGVPAENFGAALAISADVAIVGAPTQNVQTGAAYVFRRNDNRWVQETKLLSPEPGEQQFFGQAVALIGDYILVGEPGYKSRTGVIHVFAKDGQQWRPIARLSPAAAQMNDRFGAPIAVADNRVYAGAIGYRGASGAVYSFTRSGASFEETARYHGATEKAGDQFGTAIAAVSGNLWVGAPRADSARGAVYHFGADNQRPARLNIPDPVPGDVFGSAIAAHGDVAVIGAANDDFGLGSITIYQRANAKWEASGPVARRTARMTALAGKKIECNNGKADQFPCSQVDLLSFLPVEDLGGSRGVQLSGIWGWTDPETKREYALVGRIDGTAFVDVTDAVNPRYLGDLPLTPGSNPSWWREIKTYKNYMLVSADGAGAHGLQIFDLTQLRGVKTPVSFKANVVYSAVKSVHNVVVNEESGFAYAVGSNSGGETCGGGLHMIDIRDPLNPRFAGCFADARTGRANTGYSHDALCVTYRGPDRDYQNREICLGANETMLSVADVTDKKNPKAIARASYPKVGYLHQGWFTRDLRYFFMNDELDEVSGLVQNTRTLIWDLADLDDPQMVGEFIGPNKASDHNLYIRDDLMYQSNYKAGVRLIDVSNPLAPVEIGFFDTAPTQPDVPGFDGSWGNYPFFESGTWIASSVNEGLFVLKKKDNRPAM